jgi:hypothetical protein
VSDSEDQRRRAQHGDGPSPRPMACHAAPPLKGTVTTIIQEGSPTRSGMAGDLSRGEAPGVICPADGSGRLRTRGALAMTGAITGGGPPASPNWLEPAAARPVIGRCSTSDADGRWTSEAWPPAARRSASMPRRHARACLREATDGGIRTGPRGVAAFRERTVRRGALRLRHPPPRRPRALRDGSRARPGRGGTLSVAALAPHDGQDDWYLYDYFEGCARRTWRATHHGHSGTG